jgi:hypothetical protein
VRSEPRACLPRRPAGAAKTPAPRELTHPRTHALTHPRLLSHSRTFPLSHCRKGAVLLEAIVALVILSVAGTAAVVLVSQSADAVRRAREAEAEAREANAFFAAVSLWTRDDLDRRLGDRAQGGWRLMIQRPTPTLYEVVLTDSARTHEILRTSLFRPEPPRPELPGIGAPGMMP